MDGSRSLPLHSRYLSLPNGDCSGERVPGTRIRGKQGGLAGVRRQEINLALLVSEFVGGECDPGSVERCEARLRELHPYAMARFDRLRDDGVDRVEAMREAAPLFLRAPHVRKHGGGRARLAVTTEGLGHPWIDAVHGPSREGFDAHVAEVQVQRGARIIGTLQARAQAEGRPPLGEGEQRTALEAATNLPHELIRRAAIPAAAAGRRSWERDFPFPIQHVVAAARAPAASAPDVPKLPARPAPRPKRGGQ
jgi:hypothetical protein